MVSLVLRDYQDSAVESVFEYFHKVGDGNPLVVAPTGSGKSVMIAETIRRILGENPRARILVVTHVRELVEQNEARFRALWGDEGYCPSGVYSAGLKRREADSLVLFASIQSVYRKPEKIGRRDIVFVDEAHLVPKSGDGMYLTLLERLGEVAPHVRCLGWTATPYRLGSGMLTEGEGRLFTETIYDIPIGVLIEQGHLCPPRSKSAKEAIDLANVRVRGGEFRADQLQEAATADGCVEAACGELVSMARAQGRKKWLVFCAGVEHAEAVVQELKSRGVRAQSVFGDTPTADRDNIVWLFREGQFECLVNVNVLSTGFDAPDVDCVAVMRATQSPGLWVQLVGRGLRTAPGKTDCLVLDFGKNAERHGPINRVKVKGGSDKGTGEAPTKVCPNCQEVVMASARVCSDCGHEFPCESEPHRGVADCAPVIELEKPEPEWVDVSSVSYRKHSKKGGKTSLRVTYHAGLRPVDYYVCLEHSGFAHQKALRWWKAAEPAVLLVPDSVDEALTRTDCLQTPTRLLVDFSGKYPEIKDICYEPVGAREEEVRHAAD
ncbi:MAG: DEAD/DEAH box helicase family protein [Planctomycetota bacterium]